jgi:hypothetical protein
MYAALARFGYGIVKSLKPSKVKTLLTPAVKKATKPAMQGTRFASGEEKLIKGIRGQHPKDIKDMKNFMVQQLELLHVGK